MDRGASHPERLRSPPRKAGFASYWRGRAPTGSRHGGSGGVRAGCAAVAGYAVPTDVGRFTPTGLEEHVRPCGIRIRVLSGAAVVSAALFAAALACAELPPKIQVDRLLVQAEREMKDGAHWSAVVTFDRIVEISEEHGLNVPAEFWFRQAGVLHSAGLHERAVDASTRYLREAGRDGEHYRAALDILDTAEVGLAEARRVERLAELERAARERLAAKAQAQRELAGELPSDAMKDGGVAPTMVRLPAGRICFGKDNCRMVEVRAFALTKHAVTVAEFGRFARPARYRTETERGRRTCWQPGGSVFPSDAEQREERRRTWKTVSATQTGRHPVVCVSIEDANRYAPWLIDLTGRRCRLPGAGGMGLRLPGGNHRGPGAETRIRRATGTFRTGEPRETRLLGMCRRNSADHAVKIGPVGSCPLSPMGIGYEPGNFAEMLHTCNIPDNGDSADAPTNRRTAAAACRPGPPSTPERCPARSASAPAPRRDRTSASGS